MKKYRLGLAFGVVCVSTAAVLIRLANAPPLVTAAFRLCLAAIILAPIALTRSHKEIIRLSLTKLALIIVSGVLLAAHFGLWITSLSYTSVASSVVLVTSSPVIVAVISYWLFKERLSTLSIAGICICFIGAGVIGYVNWDTGALSLLGALLSLMGAIAVSGYMIIGRIVRQDTGLLSYIFLTYGTAGLILLVTALALRLPFTGYGPTTYIMLVLLAIVPQLLGHSALNWSLRYLSASEITIAILGEPVIATLMAYLILSEAPKITEIIGGIIILGGIYLALRKPPGREARISPITR